MAQIRSEINSIPDAERTSDEIVKLIRKLRWIGLDAEANALSAKLRGIELGCSTLYMPRDTD
jgi:hypothetical protein